MGGGGGGHRSADFLKSEFGNFCEGRKFCRGGKMLIRQIKIICIFRIKF